MNRRVFIATAPVAVFAGVPAAAQETPVMRLFREWERSNTEEAAVYTGTEDEQLHSAATDRTLAIERAMVTAPSQDAVDVLAKIVAASGFGVWPLDAEEHEALWIEARALVTA